MKTLIYIASSPRSGSTLLANILGSHPEVFNAGEILGLHGLLNNSRRGSHPNGCCACGKRVIDCRIWGQVFKQIHGLRDLQTEVARIRKSRSIDILFPKDEVRECFKMSKNSDLVSRVVGTNTLILEQLVRITGSNYVVDSSKSFWNVLGYLCFLPDDWRLKIIHMKRHPGATIASRLKHRARLNMKTADFYRSIVGWIHYNQILAKLATYRSVHTLSLEVLCREPDTCFNSLEDFLGLQDISVDLLNSDFDRHDLGGSISLKASARSGLVLDESWLATTRWDKKLVAEFINYIF